MNINSNTVLEKVLKKCESAVRARIPILYIKTDSDIFIQKIIDSDRLVVRLRAVKNTGDFRPEREFSSSTDYRRMIQNYKYNALNMQKRSWCTWEIPHICTFKGPVNDFGWIESYIISHEDPLDANYDMLQSSVIIIYSSKISISPMMIPYTEIIDVDYPQIDEIQNLVKNQFSQAGYYKKEICESLGFNKDQMEEHFLKICNGMLGLTTEEIDVILREMVSVNPNEKSFNFIDSANEILRRRKEQKMESSILELSKVPPQPIGGMKKLKEYLEKQKVFLINADRYRQEKGLIPPKGVLVCGIPGCGKSEAAKFTASEFNLPLLKMDVGNLMDKYQGESERKMSEALKLAEAMSPCVLWIDELEKGFGGASGENDSSSFKRMFATMLSWMQDNQRPVFIFATANNIGGLPKEFFRSGRFDALFAVYLPLQDECVDIFIACMNAIQESVKKNAAMKELDDARIFNFEIDNNKKLKHDLRKIVDNFAGEHLRVIVGADIKKIVNLAVRKLVLTVDGDNDRSDKKISYFDWIQALQDVCNDKSVNVYGDGEENINSIAVSYCRLLRKGFLPTNDVVLFSADEYDPHRSEQILKPSENIVNEGEYDNALRKLLVERINDIAPAIEQYENEILIKKG